ncbi:MAG: hypothetical protein ABSF22_21295 [Bryobacteraceae bacterium]
MSKTLAAAVLLALATPAFAHRLDEYLQATILSVEKDRVQASLRLIPGVAVAPMVLWSIDTNGDGVISEGEQKAYAERVLGDLSLSIDGYPLRPRLVSVNFPGTEEMKAGIGEIQIEYTVDLPRSGGQRKLLLENHHLSRISTYLVNVLAARDKTIQIATQNRNENQSHYELNYVQAGKLRDLKWLMSGAPLGIVGLLLLTRLAFAWRQRVTLN